ncbi:hypothetical protein MB46_05265 [Arthrobacter alpinus]|uniref:GNAT family N-acetyltransferase n=1 Tax=Arthrobacter alpinus TaxID=656366 RepID=UPI000678E834|nr:GNAT family N-acetyltransferase [Arthrobacter alpinus]ALV45002.1 hypothetical protein MB46_05265 [Arthrobacter alpinus]
MVKIRRLRPGDETMAAQMIAMMATVFEEGLQDLPGGYVQELLSRDSFWAIAAFDGTEAVGGLTGHTLPMTRSPSSEILIYDLAVREDHQRRGIAARLIQELRAAAALEGIHEIFVPADDADVGALAFYRAQGATASPVTHFTFGPQAASPRNPGRR